MNKFGKSSEIKLATVEPVLVRVCRRALEISPYDFGILCGVRDIKEQEKRLAEGNSTTLKSRHLANKNSLSEAIDFGVYVDGKYINGDPQEEIGYYRKVNQAFFTAAIELGVKIEAGDLWRTFVDAGHIQLSEDFKP